MYISRAASGDNAFFHSCSCSVQSILHTKLSFLHFSLCSSADTNNRYAASQLCESLLKLLAVEIGLCLGDLRLDLSDTVLDCFLVASSVDDGCGLLLDLNSFCLAEHIHGSILELNAEIRRDYLSAGQDCDILKHLFSSVAIARCLYRTYLEGSTELVDNQCGQCLALNILSDDQKACAGLNDFLKKRKDILNVADLLVCDQDIRAVQICLHLLHISCKVCGNISSVELHTFYKVKLCLHCLGFLDGDDAIIRNGLHRVCNHIANGFISG